jgi:hypothetical protein
MVPLKDRITHDDARKSAKLIAEAFARTDRRYITRSAPSLRAGHIFIGYLRNGRGTTAVGAYSPRARPSFPVSMPVTWKQVERGIRPDGFNIGSAWEDARSAEKPEVRDHAWHVRNRAHYPPPPAGFDRAYGRHGRYRPAGSVAPERLTLNRYQKAFLRRLTENGARFMVIGPGYFGTADLAVWADFNPPCNDALIKTLGGWRNEYPQFDTEGRKVKRPWLRIWYPDDTRLRSHGTDPEVGGINVLTKVEGFRFDEFFARAAPADADGLPLRLPAAEELPAVHPDYDA